MKLNWSKLLKASLVAGLAGVFISVALMFVWPMLFPGLEAQYFNAMFRPWSDPWMYYIYVNPFIFAFLMGVFYYYMKDALHGDGIRFGLLFWLLSIPGMLMTISTFNVSVVMVLTWTLTGLAQYLAYGLVIPKFVGK